MKKLIQPNIPWEAVKKLLVLDFYVWKSYYNEKLVFYLLEIKKMIYSKQNEGRKLILYMERERCKYIVDSESKRVTEDYKSNHTRKKNNLNLQWSSFSGRLGLASYNICVWFLCFFSVFFIFVSQNFGCEFFSLLPM